MRTFLAVSASLALTGCPASVEPNGADSAPSPVKSSASRPSKAHFASGPASKPASKPAMEATRLASPPAAGLEVATFAGGCFWCMEPPFEKLPGVKSVVSGYTGGKERHPKYLEVGTGKTGHTEAVRVTFDPDYITYGELLDVFWRNIDPTDAKGQFVDRGAHYRTGIFFHDEIQRDAAKASKKALEKSGRFKKKIVTPVEEAGDFWVAEEYHQDYYKKKPDDYKRYRVGSRRDDFIKKHWE